MKTKKALISVSDKAGVVELAKGLSGLGVEILSTGGTAKLLKEKGIRVVEVGEYTGQPEILDGRLKTLHPKIHGGILAIRSNPKHLEEIKASGIEPIDLLVINLYPFEETIAKEGVSLEHAIENIDIGGPTMIRAAAKNWPDVAVLVDPADYPLVLEELQKSGEVSRETKFRLAQKVFVLTSRYDGAIANYLTGGREGKFPDAFNLQGRKVQDLRYGENPHQKAAFYRDISVGEEASIATSRQLHGKELSYNNIMDLDGALEAVKEFDGPAVVIIKHATPCGAACSPSPRPSPQKGGGAWLRDIFIHARDCDPLSAFGGIIAINQKVDAPTAQEIGKDFYECVVAPAYDTDALEILKGKKNIRLMEIPGWKGGSGGRLASAVTLRKVTGGFLLQDRDLLKTRIKEAKVVTKRQPTDDEWQALEFAWRVCKHVKSNAIVYASPSPQPLASTASEGLPTPARGEGGIIRTIGIGGGQVSRVDATKIGISKARTLVQGAAMASDAFFPFRDNIDEAAKAGIKAIIQPGGSIKDAEVIQAADEHGIAMVFTGARHFRH